MFLFVCACVCGCMCVFVGGCGGGCLGGGGKGMRVCSCACVRACVCGHNASSVIVILSFYHFVSCFASYMRVLSTQYPSVLFFMLQIKPSVKGVTAWDILCAQFPSVLLHLCPLCMLSAMTAILLAHDLPTKTPKLSHVLLPFKPSWQTWTQCMPKRTLYNATHAYTCSAANPMISIPCCKLIPCLLSSHPFRFPQMRFCLFASWQDSSRAPFPVCPSILWFLLCNDLRHLFDVIWPRIHCNAQNLYGVCSMHPVPWCLCYYMYTASAQKTLHTLLNTRCLYCCVHAASAQKTACIRC